MAVLKTDAFLAADQVGSRHATVLESVAGVEPLAHLFVGLAEGGPECRARR